MNEALTISNDWRVVTISKWVQSDGSIRFVVYYAGKSRLYKTLNGAVSAAKRLVGMLS